jgi:hypothetical protein
MKRVLITAGHRNWDSGNPVEARETGERVRAVLDLYDQKGGKNALGFDLRTTTPDRGMGIYPGGLVAAALAGFQSDWTPDLFIELHSDNRQGAHVVYPDWGGDVDTDAKRHALLFCDPLTRHTGMPIWSGVNGALSEKQTYVGGQGHRHGIFYGTQRYAESTTRMIFEQGAHEGSLAARLLAPDFPAKAATALLESIALFFDATSPGWKAVQAPVGWTRPALPAAAAGLEINWAEVIDGAEKFTILGVEWEYERKRMRAKRAARCWSGPDLSKQTRNPLEVGEVITVVLKGKIDGKLHRVTPYGSIIRASSLEPV